MAYERRWKRVVQREGLVPAIDATIDRDTFVYATVDAVFDTSSLRALGFLPKWKSLREGYPAVLAWFQTQGWVPTYPSKSRDRQTDVRSERVAGPVDGYQPVRE
jgi:hypothetical protein